MNRLRGMIEE
jgi:hypothetical protein